MEENSYFCFEPNCEEDDIVIFPSNLKHGTKGLKNNSSNELRITIAFNVMNPDICLDKKIQDRVSYN